jgi:uncharacterized protein YndB with AHSA1/START domain
MEDIMADLLHQIDIKASPQQVYAAHATSSGLASWRTADARTEQKIGGKAEFGFNKRGVMYRMTIDALDPGKQVVWSCHGDNPEWRGTTLSGRSQPMAPAPCCVSRMAVGGRRVISSPGAIRRGAS